MDKIQPMKNFPHIISAQKISPRKIKNNTSLLEVTVPADCVRQIGSLWKQNRVCYWRLIDIRSFDIGCIEIWEKFSISSY